jgi:hypothetical protein
MTVSTCDDVIAYNSFLAWDFNISATVHVGGLNLKQLSNVAYIGSAHKVFLYEALTGESYCSVSSKVDIEVVKAPQGILSINENMIGKNAIYIEQLNGFKSLRDEWDPEEATAPSEDVIERSKDFASYLQAIGEGIFQVAPGPNGEVLIELRNHEKSVEFLFYPNRTKFVNLTTDKPSQGLFTIDMLSNLLASLNA